MAAIIDFQAARKARTEKAEEHLARSREAARQAGFVGNYPLSIFKGTELTGGVFTRPFTVGQKGDKPFPQNFYEAGLVGIVETDPRGVFVARRDSNDPPVPLDDFIDSMRDTALQLMPQP